MNIKRTLIIRDGYNTKLGNAHPGVRVQLSFNAGANLIETDAIVIGYSIIKMNSLLNIF